MEAQDWGADGAKNGNAPLHLEFVGRGHVSAGQNRNQISDPGFRYDPTGNMTRMDSDGAKHSMQWDARNRMTAVYRGDADTAAGTILDQYLYDADAYRLVRWPLAGDGKPVIAIRDAAGQTMTEFRAEPGSQRISRIKEYVSGAGQILVERAISKSGLKHSTQSPMSASGSYGMVLTAGTGASAYAVDIRTASGSSRLVTGIHPDSQGKYSIAESDLFPGEANFVRIRKDTGDPEAYSPPATIVYDPAVTAQSPNVIRALAASREGTQILLRWSYATSTTKKTKLYFERADGQALVPLTPNGLNAAITSLGFPRFREHHLKGGQAVRLVLDPATPPRSPPSRRRDGPS